jgi:DNA-binding HxlR family transcriptional regulator
MSPEPRATGSTEEAGDRPAACCPFYHEAVELIGRRWTGAILAVLLEHGPLRFSEIAQAVPELSDRLLSERMKELEARGLVARTVEDGPPVRVTYELTPMGQKLEPALHELRSWARQWLAADEELRRRQARAVRTI